MAPEGYNEFRGYLEQACGITLGDNKQYLVSGRLHRLMADHAIPTLKDLVARLQQDRHPQLRELIIDAMTTNETLWFRDGYPFEIIKNLILPALAGRPAHQVRVWSAACSTGQEPYSISMAIQEYLTARPAGLAGGAHIVATDVSPATLRDAARALYNEAELARGLSAERRSRFFIARAGQWEVRPEIRARVTFKEFNLMHDYAPMGKFDLIFCRNVLIYFSTELKRDILTRLAASLNPGGYLFLGASETVANYSEAYEMVRAPEGGLVFRLRRLRPVSLVRA
jgi:chemotaxis protein methyltransferase CheR